MKKILVAFFFVLIGFYTPSFIDAFQLENSAFEFINVRSVCWNSTCGLGNV